MGRKALPITIGGGQGRDGREMERTALFRIDAQERKVLMPRANRNPRSLAAVATQSVRCAIYTRKSTDEGLDRDFTSLDNQRQVCERYVDEMDNAVALADRYDDGGYSGARPIALH